MVPPYKVAWMQGADVSILYSRFFYTQTEARQFAQNVVEKGGEPLIMVAKVQPTNEDAQQYYEWELLPGPNVFKIRTATFLTSPKFYVPLILGILIFLLLRKNNGLSRVVV